MDLEQKVHFDNDRKVDLTDGSFDQVSDKILELGTSNLVVHVFGTRRIHGQVGQVDIGLDDRRSGFSLSLSTSICFEVETYLCS